MKPKFWRRVPGNWKYVLRIFARRPEEDVDAELRFHFDERIAELTERGVPLETARAQAQEEFGDIEAVRTSLYAIDYRAAGRRRRGAWGERVAQDVRIAVRRLRRSPVFTVAATLTLAIAIGATASVFGVVDGIIFRSFPYHAPEHVLVVLGTNPERHLPSFAMSATDFVDYQAQSRTFETLAAETGVRYTVTGIRAPERVDAALVTSDYFATLGIIPLVGRRFSFDSTGVPEVVLGYGYWMREYGGAASAVGQTLLLDNQPYSIVGVMPPGLPNAAELWVRLSLQANDLVHRDWHTVVVYGRLRPGVTRDRAQHELETIAARLAKAYPQSNAHWSVVTTPLLEFIVGSIKPALVILFAAAACVLLVGAANLANLFLVRGSARARELAVRAALGATRARLMRELLTEAATLGLAAGAIGVGAAVGGVRILRTLAPAALPRLSQVTADSRVVAFCAITSVTTVLVFGALPAWQISRGNVIDFMKDGGRSSANKQDRTMQSALVVLQVAIALILLTATGLLTKSFGKYRELDLGYRPDGVMTARFSLPIDRYATAESAAQFASNVIDRLVTLPGATAAAVSSAIPSTALYRWAVMIVGNPRFDSTNAPLLRPVYVSPGYFRVMGISIQRGRGVLPTDDHRAVKVAIIDEQLAKQAFGADDPIGAQLALIGPVMDTVQVVGVAHAVRQGGLTAETVPWVFMSLAQASVPQMATTVVVRTAGDPESQVAGITRVIAAIDPTIPVFDVKSMSVRVAESEGITRFSTFLVSLFAGITLILGAVGIYSVLTYVVVQRKREIAIRLALGASQADVMTDVLRRALVLTTVGISIGLGASWWLTRTFAAFFEGVDPHDPGIFAGAAAAFGLVALIAAAAPALRTTRIDPASVLSST
jgi:putative ABC transport system permease protein